VDLVDAGDAGGMAANANDPAVRARRDDDEAAVPHIGDEGLLADERVLHDLALTLDAKGRRNDSNGIVSCISPESSTPRSARLVP